MKIKLWVNTGFVNCKHVDEDDIEDDEWNKMSSDDREHLLDELAKDFLFNCVDYGACPVEEE